MMYSPPVKWVLNAKCFETVLSIRVNESALDEQVIWRARKAVTCIMVQCKLLRVL